MDLVEKKCESCHKHKLQLWRIKLTGQLVCKRCYHKIYQAKWRVAKEASVEPAPVVSLGASVPPEVKSSA